MSSLHKFTSLSGSSLLSISHDYYFFRTCSLRPSERVSTLCFLAVQWSCCYVILFFSDIAPTSSDKAVDSDAGWSSNEHLIQDLFSFSLLRSWINSPWCKPFSSANQYVICFLPLISDLIQVLYFLLYLTCNSYWQSQFRHHDNSSLTPTSVS